MKYHHHQQHNQQLHSPNAGMQLMAASRCTSGTCCPGSSGSGLRSLICDPNGIIIAEAVYRCMVCAELFEALEEMHLHYQVEHLATSELPTPSPSTPSTYSRGSASFFGSPVATTVTDYEDDPKFEMSVAAERAISSASSYNDHYGQLVNGNLLQVPKQKKKKKPVKSAASAAAASVDTPLVDPAVKEGNLKAAATAKEPSPKANGKINAVGKGGYVTCEVCDLTRFYSHISRRYGVFSCESCAKFFYRYSQKPVKYACATGTGRCPLNINLPGARCKSCLLEACFKKYILDPKKHPKIFANEAAIFSPFNVLIAGDGNGCVKGGGPVGNNSAPKVNATEGEESPPSLLKQQLSQASTAKTVAATFPFSAEVLNPKKRKSCPATSNEKSTSHPPNSSSANNKQLCRR